MSNYENSHFECEWIPVRKRGRILLEVNPQNPHEIRVLSKWYGEKVFITVNLKDYLENNHKEKTDEQG
jgi:hypothetical protein